MSGCPVLILRAKGPQDASLTVAPTKTFFKAIYPRHTNFSFEDMEVVSVAGNQGFGREVTFQLPKSGDLVTRAFLYMEIPPIIEWGNPEFGKAWWKIFDPFLDDIARIMIKKIEFKVGGTTIEEMTGEFMHVYDQLSRDPSTSYVDNTPTRHGGTILVDNGGQTGMTKSHIYVPLQFSFCLEDGMAFPMIALQYHDAKIVVTLNTKEAIFTQVVGGPNYPGTSLAKGVVSWDHPDIGGLGYREAMMNAMPDITKLRLLCRFVYLDDFERKQFAEEKHQYLITETQHYSHYVSEGSGLETIGLSFSHPVKELIFYYKADNRMIDPALATDPTAAYWNFTNKNSKFGDGHLFERCNLSLNSQQMFGEGRDPIYFSYVLPLQFHTRLPSNKHVYVIPFALEPENWKPTGSLNFSRMDTVKLLLLGLQKNSVTHRLPKGVIEIYARSFNVLAISSGMGGKRFAS